MGIICHKIPTFLPNTRTVFHAIVAQNNYGLSLE